MQVEGVLVNDATLMCCLKACSSIKVEERGRQSHMRGKTGSGPLAATEC